MLDPDFSLAHAGIANAYALRASMYAAGDEWDEQESGFASLRDEPGFQAALEKQRQLRGEMRARVNVMLHEQ